MLVERDRSRRDEHRGAFWRLLFETLMLKLRFQARGAGQVEQADLEDVSSEKALELLLRAETGAWSLADRTASDISGYVSNVARNGWVDHLQRRARQPLKTRGEPDQEPLLDSTALGRASERPVAHGLLAALSNCIEALPARGRRVWFFRTYYEMSGREIAAHPLVQLNAPHVDVLVQRTRVALRDCLHRKGQTLEDAAGGAFVELWDLLETLAKKEQDASQSGRGHDD